MKLLTAFIRQNLPDKDLVVLGLAKEGPVMNCAPNERGTEQRLIGSLVQFIETYMTRRHDYGSVNEHQND